MVISNWEVERTGDLVWMCRFQFYILYISTAGWKTGFEVNRLIPRDDCILTLGPSSQMSSVYLLSLTSMTRSPQPSCGSSVDPNLSHPTLWNLRHWGSDLHYMTSLYVCPCCVVLWVQIQTLLLIHNSTNAQGKLHLRTELLQVHVLRLRPDEVDVVKIWSSIFLLFWHWLGLQIDILLYWNHFVNSHIPLLMALCLK